MRALGRSLLVVSALSVMACGGPAIPPRPAPQRITEVEALVEEYYRRLNAEQLSALLSVMAPEPELVEPFSASGRPTTHRGYRAVARFFAEAFRSRDDHVVVEFVRPSAMGAHVGWSMHGTDGTGMSGQSRFEIREGLITRIEIQERE